jgi:hypothetical protein
VTLRLLALWVAAAALRCACAAAEPVHVLALAFDVASCERLAKAVAPFGVEMAVVAASPETLAAIAGDGAELRSLFDVLFIQQGKELPARAGSGFLALCCDALEEGMGLVLEGGASAYGASGFEGTHLARYAPVVGLGAGPESYVTGRTDRALVQDEHSPLLRYLGWGGSPPISSYCLLRARREATVHLTAGGYPLLLDWRAGKARVVAFAGGLTGAWAKEWESWRSFDAFRARLFLAAGGVDDKALKGVVARK